MIMQELSENAWTDASPDETSNKYITTCDQYVPDNAAVELWKPLALHMHMYLVRHPDSPARALELTARHSIHHWAVGRSYHDRIPKPELLESRTLPLGISDRVSTRIC